MFRMILLPGLDGTGKMFSPLMNELPADFDCKVIAYPESLEFVWSAYADYVMREAGDLNGAWLLAESFSGPVALTLLAKHNPKIQGLILAATFAKPPHPWLLNVTRVLPISLLARVPPPMLLLRTFLIGWNSTPELGEALKNTLREVSPAVLAGRLKMLRAMPNLSQVPPEIPCLYFQALKDWLINPTSFDSVHTLFPNVVKSTLWGSHLILQAEAKAAADTIREFAHRREIGKPT